MFATTASDHQSDRWATVHEQLLSDRPIARQIEPALNPPKQPEIAKRRRITSPSFS